EMGVRAAGINLWPGSRRFVPPDRAPDLLDARPAGVEIFGIFVNAAAEEIVKYTVGLELDVVQLHGDETPEAIRLLRSDLPRDRCVRIVKAIRVRDAFPAGEATDFEALADGLLFDSGAGTGYGGTGTGFDYGLLAGAGARFPFVILSGGLNAGNVERAIRLVCPHMVDVCSGVESAPGIKDRKKLESFVNAARRASISVSYTHLTLPTSEL
ncbi:MAG: phosphoribosylanthranilate isomerase, partial [Planctomycetota bacterium]|nr:phosphoribosylanthranilate isomerase [Planctomycetota bacterium]